MLLDYNPNAAQLTAQLTSKPIKGTMLAFNSDGTFTYLPATNYVGTDTFTYTATDGTFTTSPVTVTITVLQGIAVAPTALAGTLAVQPNTPTNGYLTSINPDGLILYSLVSQGKLGTVTITNAGSGAYTYTPNAGAIGTDTFVFSVGSAANLTLSTTATITVTVVGITLTTNLPPPQLTGTPITLTASAAGIGTIQYRFIIEYRNADGTWSNNTIDTGYQSSATYVWTPLLPELYTLVAYAKDSVGNNPSTYITYTVRPANLTSVTVTANPSTQQVLGTSIILTAAAQGGIAPGDVQYQFLAEYRNPDGSWATPIMLQDYSTSAQCTWTPLLAHLYTVVINARVVGSTNAYDVESYILFNITPVNLIGVTITSLLAAPQHVDTQIVLTATAYGGIAFGNVEYQFVGQYKAANGTLSLPTVLRDYSTNPMYAWIPTAASNYQITVNARVVGVGDAYNVYNYITYNILP